MALQTSSVAASIAGYSVGGVKIKDLGGFIENVTSRDTPLLMPAPDFFNAPEIVYDSFGTGASAAITVTYVLRYRFFHTEVGSLREFGEIFADFVEKTTAIVDAVIAADATTDAIHLQVSNVGAFGVVVDAVENEFYGNDIDIQVTEYVN